MRSGAERRRDRAAPRPPLPPRPGHVVVLGAAPPADTGSATGGLMEATEGRLPRTEEEPARDRPVAAGRRRVGAAAHVEAAAAGRRTRPGAVRPRPGGEPSRLPLTAPRQPAGSLGARRGEGPRAADPAPRRRPPLPPGVPWLPGAGHGRRRGRSRLFVGALAVVVAAAAASVQWGRVPSPLPVRLAGAAVVRVAGQAPALPWPPSGQAALSVPSLGRVITPGPQAPVPIASLVKIMTAYVVLRDHPLAPGDQGPAITMGADDQRDAADDARRNETSVPVTAGEVLTERQVLDGLLVHSANNLADTLARWDAGSVPAFVAEMNATAAQLGMVSTTYVDANGFGLPDGRQSVSTAADQLRVAAAMANPTFAAVVAQRTVTLPLVGTVTNYVPSIGQDGIVGGKSGFTQASMGCEVLAAVREVGGRSVLMLAAALGQPAPDPLGSADHVDRALLDAAGSSLVVVRAVAAGEQVARVEVPWGGGVATGAAASLTLVAWPGDVIRRSLRPRPLHPGSPAGSDAGVLDVVDGVERSSVPVRTVATVPGVPLAWRLFRL